MFTPSQIATEDTVLKWSEHWAGSLMLLLTTNETSTEPKFSNSFIHFNEQSVSCARNHVKYWYREEYQTPSAHREGEKHGKHPHEM